MDVDDMEVDDISESSEGGPVFKAPMVLVEVSKKRRAMDDVEMLSAKRQVMNEVWA